MSESIAISSGKGGVGKTSIAVNIGAALSELGRKVAIVDGSLTTPDISLHLGIPFHVRSIKHILNEGSNIEEIKEVVFHHKSGLKVIPGHIHNIDKNESEDFHEKKFEELLGKLKEEYDFVLVDCAPGLGREAVSAIKSCNKMLVVANPELTSVVNSSKAIQIAKGLNVEPIGVILNRVGRFEQELKEEDMESLFHGFPVISRIPEDKKIPISARNSETIIEHFPKCRVSREIRNIALHLCGEKQVITKKPASSQVTENIDHRIQNRSRVDGNLEEIFTEAPPEHTFKLRNGQEIKTLKELAGALIRMDDETFNHHVNLNDNHFANWVKDIFKNNELAEKIRVQSTRDELQKLIK